MIQVGMYVNIASIQRTGRVLQLADYRKVPNGNGVQVIKPHGAVVIFPDKSGAVYPFEMMQVVEAPEKKNEQPAQQQPAAKEQAPVWTWCPVCWDRTDHRQVKDMLVCVVCGNRVQNTVKDTSSSYIVPTEDDEKLPEMAGSQTVAAG